MAAALLPGRTVAELADVLDWPVGRAATELATLTRDGLLLAQPAGGYGWPTRWCGRSPVPGCPEPYAPPSPGVPHEARRRARRARTISTRTARPASRRRRPSRTGSRLRRVRQGRRP
ncbi:hypothetical protein ENC19_28690 [Verrucosispora sp. CWR15]|uniref:Uncharacterized protein n=1 Tax=Verrucosispora sioxanthis TaxID=2499994 RepID=A0A6M1LDH1_9ACTN|nr:hypothetical protein [Verrucosispora sioxanthis]NEE67206.1 hypothetical protein [Verrucosispora sioxanthis]NGM16316.1 hypothetical protein [Verrucosispora sioxanthis]